MRLFTKILFVVGMFFVFSAGRYFVLAVNQNTLQSKSLFIHDGLGLFFVALFCLTSWFFFRKFEAIKSVL